MTAVISADGIGYDVGSGGTVTQLTSKSTAVTLNKPTGRITMSNAALGAGASIVFQVNNSFVDSADVVVVTSNFAAAAYRAQCYKTSSGTFGIIITNTDTVSRSDAVGINFAIIKGATS